MIDREAAAYWIPAFRGYDDFQEAARSSLDLPRFFRQHDRDAVADRIGEFGRTRDQFLSRAVELQRPLGQRADQDFQQFRVDGAFKAFGRGGHGRSPAWVFAAVAYSTETCSRAALIA